MKTKKLSKKIRLTSKTLIVTVIFLLFSTFPGNALEKEEKKVAGTVPVAVATMVGETETMLPGTTEILHNQLDGITGDGITSQDFEAALNDFDSEAADDFEVPTGQDWTINTVTVYGFLSKAGAVLNQVRVRFYNDVFGLPATSIIHQSLVSVNTTGNFIIPLPQPLLLNSGRYWVSVQAILDYGTQGQWYWNERTVQYPNSYPSVWRNPGGGFGTPCTNWGSRVWDCAVGNSPDLIFALGGTRTTTGGPTVRFPTDFSISRIEPFFNFGEPVEVWKNCYGADDAAGEPGSLHSQGFLYHTGIDIIHADAFGTHEVNGTQQDYNRCKNPSLQPTPMEVYPIAAGIVANTDWRDGDVIVINHGNIFGTEEDIYSAYWHINKTNGIEIGTVLDTETLIGTIGNYGYNPHLHLEIRNFSDIWIGDFKGYTVDYPTAPINGKYYINPCEFIYDHGGDVPSSCGDYHSQAETSLDLCFVIDTTASMGGCLASIKTNANYIMNKVEDLGYDYRVALIDYRDFPQYPYGVPNIDYPYNVVLDFSNNRTAIINGINSMNIGDGGDWQDSVYSGLIGTLQSEGNLSSWRTHANKYIIVLGDAPPHSPEPVTGYTFSDVMAAIWNLANQSSSSLLEADDLPLTIQPIVIGYDPATISAFTEMAEETGGTMVTAADASEIVNALASVLENIADDITGGDPENNAPDVSLAIASPASLWPPSNKMQEIQILDVVDPDGDPVTITITAITQDEPVNQTGSKNKEPDAEGIGTDTAWVRAERDGNGNGRVYKITFEASDDKGATAEGSVFVCVPHDQGEGTACIDDGQNYDSTSSI